VREGRIQGLVSMTCMPAAFFHYCSGIIINMAVIISTIVITARYDRHAYTVNIYIYDVIALIKRNNEAISPPKQHHANMMTSAVHTNCSGQWPTRKHTHKKKNENFF